MPDTLIGQDFNPSAAALAGKDQRAAFDMYNLYTTGKAPGGGRGPFDDFYEAWFGPIANALVNAKSFKDGTMPQSLGDLFDRLQAGMSGQKDLYGFLSDYGQQALAAALAGGRGEAYDTTAQVLQTLAPLMSFGMDQPGRNAFYNDQGDLLRSMMTPNYYKDNLGYGEKGPGNGMTWGQYALNDPFFRRYYSGPANNYGNGAKDPNYQAPYGGMGN